MRLDRFQQRMVIVAVAVVLLALSSCRRTLPYASDITPTPREGLTVWESLQGEWQVSQTRDMTSSYLEQLGVLEIDGTSYTFSPSSQTEGGSAVDQRLQFLFDAPEGEVRIEYVDGVRGSAKVRLFNPYDTLAVYTFETDFTASSFLVMVGEGGSLFLHSLSSEVSLWSISKSF